MTEKDMKKKIIKRLRELEKHFNYKYEYKIYFKLNSQRVMGSYDPVKDILLFNMNVALNAGWEIYKEVVDHEFTHLITIYKYGMGVQDHGTEWKNIMRKIGATNIKATIDLSAYIDGLIPVECKCKTYYITKNRLTRMQNGRKYRCPSCNKKLKEIKG